MRTEKLWQEGNSFAGHDGLFGNAQWRALLSQDSLNGLLDKLARAVLLDLGGKNRQQNSIGGAPIPRSWSWTSLLGHKVHVFSLGFERDWLTNFVHILKQSATTDRRGKRVGDHLGSLTEWSSRLSQPRTWEPIGARLVHGVLE